MQAEELVFERDVALREENVTRARDLEARAACIVRVTIPRVLDDLPTLLEHMVIDSPAWLITRAPTGPSVRTARERTSPR